MSEASPQDALNHCPSKSLWSAENDQQNEVVHWQEPLLWKSQRLREKACETIEASLLLQASLVRESRETAIRSEALFAQARELIKQAQELCLHTRQTRSKSLEQRNGRMPIGTLLDITAQRLANRQLRAALAEKDMLLREIHHRIKNHMQTISALVELEAAQIADPAALAGFTAVAHRIQAMARLHEHLYGTQDLQHIDLAAYLQDLGCGLAALHKGRPVSIHVVAEPLTCVLDVAMPIGLIATELVTNSLKHAFPEGRNGAIHIHLRRHSDDLWFEVADDGIRSNEQPQPRGMGKRLIKALVEQLSAKLDVVRDGGYRTRLVVPMARFSNDR